MRHFCHCNAIIVVTCSIVNLYAQIADTIPETIIVQPTISTDSVEYDADDPAIWIHPSNPDSSLIIGTDKGTYPHGGLFAWNMDGTQHQRLYLSHPNNVDVRYGLVVNGEAVDIAAITMRDDRQIRVFAIDPQTRMLTDITAAEGINIFRSPYGLALYQRPSDGAIFAFVSSKHRDFLHELWQIKLEDDGTGQVKGTLVRKFGNGEGIIEGMVADDELGFLYVAEQRAGIHKYQADPEEGDEQLALFATEMDTQIVRKGLALYRCGDSTGYLLMASPVDKSVKVFRREGEPGFPHLHHVLTTIRNSASEAGVGVEVTNVPASRDFPHGALIWHNESGKQFRLYAWQHVAQNYLSVCDGHEITSVVESEDDDSAISDLELSQNYPNPFNPETNIRFRMPKSNHVELAIYDSQGRKIRTLHSGLLTAGWHLFTWGANDDSGQAVTSGTYYLQLRSRGFSEVRKMTLVR